MSSFTDLKLRLWTVDVTISALRRISSVTGLNLGDFGAFQKDGAVSRISTDPVMLATVVYAACKPQCDAMNVDINDFCDAIRGDILNDAANALLDSLADFFPSAQSKLLHRALETSREQQTQAEAKLDEAIAEMGATASA